MTVRLPTQGQRILLEAAVGKRPQESLELRLFTNPALDLGSLTEADLEELAVDGYAPQLLNPQAWKVEAGSYPIVLVHPAVRFMFREAAGLVRGYYVTQYATGVLVWWELFAQPVNGRRRGDRVTVVPRLVARSA